MNRLDIKTDIVYNANLKKEITIIHLSDIHFSLKFSKRDLYKIERFLNKTLCDYVVLTGDTLDEPSITRNKKINELVEFFKRISRDRKVIIGIGNHDIISLDDLDFFHGLQKIDNVFVLDNKNYQDEFVNITGLLIDNSYYYNVEYREPVNLLANAIDNQKELIDKISNDKVNILLLHSPINVPDKEIIKRLCNFDLILSGHTHGGMVPNWLGFLFGKNTGIVSPSKQLFPKVARGRMDILYNKHVITLIINGAYTKLSRRSGAIFSNLNFLYNKSVNKIIIRKK